MAEFCSARSNTISPPQWTSFSPPLTALYFDQPGDMGYSGTYLSLLNQFAADDNTAMIAKAHENFLMLGPRESFMEQNFLSWQKQLGYPLPEPEGMG